ncbi:hypothetical protein QQM39_13695 [Streptomyces sp. DT2A-34]|uniref:hypothetical protein n=1 Tax=Streptomyces sp. DT2A-34 TaxID=3051182 RepID=UPI00265B8E3E|nr:hypothetical protein [Streptomyces sp. DT2A-34]MDO0911860.1 hypothetical protein [Streptomyces sp. DT2A-34]
MTVGERRRRVWRWVVGVWMALVAVGGGLTLFIQDSVEARAPYVGEGRSPMPTSTADGGDCPRPTPEPGGTVAYACVFKVR